LSLLTLTIVVKQLVESK